VCVYVLGWLQQRRFIAARHSFSLPLTDSSVLYPFIIISRELTERRTRSTRKKTVVKKQEPVGARIYKCERVYIIVKLPRLLFLFIHYQGINCTVKKREGRVVACRHSNNTHKDLKCAAVPQCEGRFSARVLFIYM
jgi:hypothetical protein